MKNIKLVLVFLVITVIICLNLSTAINKQDRNIRSNFSENSISNNEPLSSIKGITSYIEQDPIVILNDSAFGSSGYNFDGYGNQTHPFLIDGLNITDSINDLIYIENTTKYFRINNCLLNNIQDINLYKSAIKLNNVTHGTISSNTINNGKTGIWLVRSSNNTIMYNTIHGFDGHGIFLENNAINNTIYKNIIDNKDISPYTSGFAGIELRKNSDNNNISSNIICYLRVCILVFDYCNNNILTNNTICHSNDGFNIFDSLNNTLINNKIYELDDWGINLAHSNNTIIFNNEIFNSLDGIRIVRAFNNFINHNFVYNNWGYGIEIKLVHDYISKNNYVNWNNFIANNQGGWKNSQALDESMDNNISYNYWDDWITPDKEEPYGIVDTPYPFDGGTNSDPFPLINTIPNIDPLILPVAHNHGNNTVSVVMLGKARHYWYYIDGIDTQNHTWGGCIKRTLPVGTYTLYAYGNNTLGKVTQNSVNFTIGPHILFEPEILTPNGGVFKEELTIRWTPAIDSYGHQLTYDLYYSNNNDSTWELIVANISSTNYNWNITDIPNGSSYRVKIVTKCSEGSIIETISSIFTIENYITTTTTNITPAWSFPLLVITVISLVAIKKKGV